jgi:hypothetical protein
LCRKYCGNGWGRIVFCRRSDFGRLGARPRRTRPQPPGRCIRCAMPSNSTGVCFDCRTTVRREQLKPKLPVCSQCHKPCIHLGKKIAIPCKSNSRAWELLRKQYFESNARYWQAFFKRKVATRHELERQIAELKALPTNEGRRITIRKLRSHLASM